MKILDKALMYIFVFTIPSLPALFIWDMIGHPPLENPNYLWAYNLFGWMLMIWIVVAFIISIRMIINSKLRLKILAKITNINEQDERESIVYGEAAKKSYLSTVSLALFLLFLSIQNIEVARELDININQDKSGHVKIGFNFNLIEGSYLTSIESPTTSALKKNELSLFHYSGLPLTKGGTILLLIIWQLCSYQFFVKKLLRA